MLNLIELYDLFDGLGTPIGGRRLVENARKEAPVGEFQSRGGNVITWYSSIKMGMAIGAENRTVKFPAIMQYEHDSMILEYYAKPCQIDLILTDDGKYRPSRVQHSPDFLLIRTDQLLLEKWYDEDRLAKLAEKYPGRYVLEDDGWHFPEAEAQLAELGITYHLRSSVEHPRQYVSNLTFLADYLSPSCPHIDKNKLEIIRSAFDDKVVLHLYDLLAIPTSDLDTGSNSLSVDNIEDSAHSVTVDDIYKAIADGQIAFDLLNDDISETNRVQVYRDITTLNFYRTIETTGDANPRCRLDATIEVGAEVIYEGLAYRIDLVGDKSVMLSSKDGATELSLELLLKQHADGRLAIRSNKPQDSTEDQLSTISPKDLQIALDRAKAIDQAKFAPSAVIVSKRTLQRYKKVMREAGESAVDQHLALVPRTKYCGNRVRKIPKELIELIKNIVKTAFNNPTNINKHTAYKLFLDSCNTAVLRPCSKKTFNKEVELLASTHSRRGKRVAYQNQPIVWYLKFDGPIHGVRPFQFVHIDHTPLDILANSPNSKEAPAHVWLSLAIDAESRHIVGFYLSFEPPSYRACMMVLRDIVRRHGRMPDMIVVDNGKEFKSREFMRVCQLYGCSIRYRPAGQPRHGSVMERLFGTVNSQVIHNLNGNTQIMKYVRTVTKTVHPINFVEWTLPALHGALDYYFENLYGTENHPAHGEEPIKHFKKRMIETGMRRHKLTRFDRTFLIETCPAPDATGTRIVDGQRGIKIDHIWYWTDFFRGSGLGKKPVEVRVDPWDVRVVYALVKGQWKQCISKLGSRLRNYTQTELRYAFEELAREKGVKKKELSPERIVDWLKILDSRNFDQRIRQQQSEARLVYGPLGMTTIEPLSDQSPIQNSVLNCQNLANGDENETSLDTISSILNDKEEEYELF